MHHPLFKTFISKLVFQLYFTNQLKKIYPSKKNKIPELRLWPKILLLHKQTNSYNSKWQNKPWLLSIQNTVLHQYISPLTRVNIHGYAEKHWNTPSLQVYPTSFGLPQVKFLKIKLIFPITACLNVFKLVIWKQFCLWL